MTTHIPLKFGCCAIVEWEAIGSVERSTTPPVQPRLDEHDARVCLFGVCPGAHRGGFRKGVATMKTKNFRAQLEHLTATEIRAGAPAVAIMLALITELTRVGIIAAAAHDMDHEDARRLVQRLKRK